MLRPRLFALLSCLALFAFVALPALADNWPQWRGPHANGVIQAEGLPTEWGPEKNIAWRVPLPEAGNSTPIVWEDRIFLTQPLAEQNQRTLLCLDRANGQTLWQKGVEYADEDPTHQANPYASASPVTDGERVIVWYGSAGVHCYDLDGKELWSRDLGVQRHMWGYAASPLIHGDVCILSFGPGTREFVLGLNKHTGETLWQYDVPGPPEGGDHVENGQGTTDDLRAQPDQKRDEILRGSWATPIIIRTPGDESTPPRDELIVPLPRQLVAFDPQTGKKLWWCDGLGALIYGSPVYADGVVMVFGGYQAASIAVKVGGAGDVTDTHRLWREAKSSGYLGTGVVDGEYLYTNTIRGNVQCIKWRTNEILDQRRLNSASGNNGAWASLVLADGKIYAINQASDVFVLEPTPEMKLLHTNTLGERTNSTVVVSDGQLLIRTHAALWCIGAEEK